jgi:hypothetical protein
MTVIINGTSGITFPDGTTQLDGLATPVPVADGGTGAATAADARTALGTNDAANITTGTLAVARGGTGAATLTANNVLLGNGTSALQAVAPGSNGNILTSNGTTWQSTAPAGGGVTSLNGQTGAITNTSYQAIGSYVMGFAVQNFNVNSTYSSFSVYNALADSENARLITGNSAGAVSGTWRCMGYSNNAVGYGTMLFVRIS